MDSTLIDKDTLIRELNSEIEWLRARVNPNNWESIFIRWVKGETDVLDFQQQPIPDRLRKLLEVNASASD